MNHTGAGSQAAIVHIVGMSPRVVGPKLHLNIIRQADCRIVLCTQAGETNDSPNAGNWTRRVKKNAKLDLLSAMKPNHFRV